MPEQVKKTPICMALLAHVDAGKTTLSEAMLYSAGATRRLGRVDHGDAFLDTYALERKRGITIFSKQARFSLPEAEITLLDTPGHVDFSAEAERTLSVLDYAVLVISGTDGVQGHTETLWQLLKTYNVPTFIFVNKMDLAGADEFAIMASLSARLGDECINFTHKRSDFAENLAMCDEALMEEYLEKADVSDDGVRKAIAARHVFPCFFGAALKNEGVEELLDALQNLTLEKKYPSEFSAQVYKISRDGQGARVTFLKVTGGTLRVKMPVKIGETEEKIDQIRLYSGEKYTTVNEATAGMVCAVTGLSETFAGQRLGGGEAVRPVLQSVLTYRVIPPETVSVHDLYAKMRILEEEDPALRVEWSDEKREVRVRVMGDVQLEILESLILERFGFSVQFGEGSIAYKETIKNTVEGVGHFEPLRHYAEAHLILSPLPLGSGLVFDTICPEDDLDLNWQRLILTHLYEKTHLGVLTGSPITDMRISLASGRAHLKHTEGGDFREATYRAVRHGLMNAESQLLEPWYDFTLTLPADCLGRAMSDLQQKCGEFDAPENVGDMCTLRGSAPVSEMRGYAREVQSYTHGRGSLSCVFNNYRTCHDAEKVIKDIGYDPELDTANTPNSVFCAHGAGYTVKWNEVYDNMHLDRALRVKKAEEEPAQTVIRKTVAYAGTREEDRELQKIFERTYGKIADSAFYNPKPAPIPDTETMLRQTEVRESYLLVDGYNIIFAWDELKALARDNLDLARETLIHLLCNYQGFRKCNLILVFDAYKVTGGVEKIEKHSGIFVVYTREAEIADVYIEKVASKIGRRCNVRVATSDSLEQLIVLGQGALRVSASAFHDEVMQTSEEIKKFIAQLNAQ